MNHHQSKVYQLLVNIPPIWPDGSRRKGSAVYDAFWKGYDNPARSVKDFYIAGSLTSAAFQAGKEFLIRQLKKTPQPPTFY